MMLGGGILFFVFRPLSGKQNNKANSAIAVSLR